MDPLHARYPFLPAARAAVDEADDDLVEVIERAGPVVERARERVERCIESRTVGDPHRSNRVELLSYPVARVLVSLLDEPALIDRYASAEAETALGRLRADGDESTALQSLPGGRFTRTEFLAAIGLGSEVVDTGGGYDVDVTTYLRLADGLDDEAWRLVYRALDGGTVPVSAPELDDLLREAVRDRVAADLPLPVPDAVGEALSAQVADLRSMLSDFSVDDSIDDVEPSLFPPCMKALEARVRDDRPMPDHSTFAYTAFLATIGMGGEEIAAGLESHPALDAAVERYRIDHLTDGDGVAYLPPSCETMKAYGDCVNQDELCSRIEHPLEYYERRLDGDEPGAGHTSRVESQ